jgi:exopolyphosphatase/guanosine-5'-triphosphate,3'-diphosphate pyrophosphatase
MSPTSYLTAPPRVAGEKLATRCAGLKPVADRLHAYDAGVRVAVVDLGTNSTRLLIADIEDGELQELGRRSTVTRLGDGVDSSGRLSEAAIERVYDVLADYRRLIDAGNADHVVAVATSAVRDADNGEPFREELRERFGLHVQIIPGEEEARLTFLGATAHRSDRGAELMVMDIGGGSTEFVVGHPGSDPGFHVSTTLGSVRHTERHLENDPPEHEELDALCGDARRIIEGDVPTEVRESVDAGIAVAGTATQLASVDLAARGDGGPVHGHRLELETCRDLLERLASLPLETRRDVPGLDPDRAPTIVAGAAILVQGIEAFGLDWIEVSVADILHGAALDAWVQET